VARPNLHRPEFDDVREHPGFRCRRARLGRQAGAESLGVSLWEVPPGEAAYPYHWHLAEEEILIVLDGRPSLRTPAGWDELEPGDVVSCLVGEGGAHQVVNRTAQDVRLLSFSNQAVEIVVYPDSDKLGAYGRGPDSDLRRLFRRGDAVDYWEGETPP
jgi:uncharacterized cupin superfamily protein